MALDTDLYDQVTKIKEAIIAMVDLELDEFAIHIHEDMQSFSVPACSITLITTKIVRLNESQGRWETNWLIAVHHNPMSEPNRAELAFNILATIMKGFMKIPTLDGTAINTDASEGSSEVVGTMERDQGVETLGFVLQAIDEPVDIPTSL